MHPIVEQTRLVIYRQGAEDYYIYYRLCKKVACNLTKTRSFKTKTKNIINFKEIDEGHNSSIAVLDVWHLFVSSKSPADLYIRFKEFRNYSIHSSDKNNIISHQNHTSLQSISPAERNLRICL